MTVLVAAASKHGATAEIAEAIGEVLTAHGVDVDVKRMDDVDTITPYDAFVLGSAIYMGQWLHGARDFVEEHHELISSRPTWLFSSGPIAEQPVEEPDLGEVTAATHAREHRVFGGRLDRSHLGLVEHLATRAVHAPEGDYREWDAVTAWATAIARVVTTELHV
jgi:menaquinone-dependent protoporphyrinogen oxidase